MEKISLTPRSQSRGLVRKNLLLPYILSDELDLTICHSLATNTIVSYIMQMEYFWVGAKSTALTVDATSGKMF